MAHWTKVLMDRWSLYRQATKLAEQRIQEKERIKIAKAKGYLSVALADPSVLKEDVSLRSYMPETRLDLEALKDLMNTNGDALRKRFNDTTLQYMPDSLKNLISSFDNPVKDNVMEKETEACETLEDGSMIFVTGSGVRGTDHLQYFPDTPIPFVRRGCTPDCIIEVFQGTDGQLKIVYDNETYPVSAFKPKNEMINNFNTLHYFRVYLK